MKFVSIKDSIVDNKLPDESVLLSLLEYLDSSSVTLENLYIIKQDFIQSVSILTKMYRSTDIYEETISDILTFFINYSAVFSALVAIGKTISTKIETLYYKQLTEDAKKIESPTKTGKLSLSQGDRDKYSKSEVAAIDGVVKVLEGLEKEIRTRQSIVNPSKSKY